MAYNDPANRAMLRLESRRFASRCEAQESSMQRADTLREVFRLASITMPSSLADDMDARDSRRRLLRAAEDRAKELIVEQLEKYRLAEDEFRQNFKVRMLDDWGNLTGPLSHLRAWAKAKQQLVDQAM